MTPIEQTLFWNGTAHWIAAFGIHGDRIEFTLHPWDRPELRMHATFDNAKVLSVDDYSDDGDRAFPWDIIGFDSEPISADRWRYCLHTDKMEYCFEAGWPDFRNS